MIESCGYSGSLELVPLLLLFFTFLLFTGLFSLEQFRQALNNSPETNVIIYTVLFLIFAIAMIYTPATCRIHRYIKEFLWFILFIVYNYVALFVLG